MRRFFGAVGRFFWRFMVIFSFVVNIILVIVLLVLGLLIFEIKNQVAEPLVEGLHSSFVGLDQATIDWTIPVRDQIQVELNIPLETNTVVVLTQPVPLQVDALIDLPGINAYNVNATVDLELPAGLELPVALDLDVAVDEPLDVELDVRAVIPLAETQLHDVAHNLRLQLEPLAIALNNLPNSFSGAAQMVGDVLSGDPPDLLAPNAYSVQPWPGYSITAGLGYDLYGVPIPPENVPMETGIVQVGGMPFLDEQIRPELYELGGPEAINQQVIQSLQAQGVAPLFFREGVGELMIPGAAGQTTPPEPASQQDQGIITPAETAAPAAPSPTPSPSTDQGIITPGDGG